MHLIRFPLSLEYVKTIVVGKHFEQYLGKAMNVTKQDYDFSSPVIYLSVVTSAETRIGQPPVPMENEQLLSWRDLTADQYCVDSSTL